MGTLGCGLGPEPSWGTFEFTLSPPEDGDGTAGALEATIGAREESEPGEPISAVSGVETVGWWAWEWAGCGGGCAGAVHP